jgi:glycosyltransferase involved in cell wall biosynthesis
MVYNEIRFIRRTLESILFEADEILISDYGSTDGTLEVLEEFSAKYPKIIYINHKDLSLIDRWNWFFQNARGKYIRLIGGHDMISGGSSKNMAALLDSDPDAVMAYSKYCIELNSDYSFYNFLNMQESWIKTLSADSPFERVRGIIFDHHAYIYYSLYRKDVLRAAITPSVFTKFKPDVGIITLLASKGKLLEDDSSIFFWMNPRPRLDYASELKRTALTMSQGKTDHPFYWPFLIMCEQYGIAQNMQTWGSAPVDFSNELLNHIVYGHQDLLLDDSFETNSFTLPSFQIQPGKEYLCNKILNAILDFKRERELEQERKLALEREELERKRKQNARLSKRIKRIIKYILPYGLIRYTQWAKN